MVEERNHGRRDRNHLARGNVDIIHAARLDALNVGAHARGDAVVDERAVRIERLLRLRDVAAVLFVRREIHNLVQHARLFAAVVDQAVRRFDKAVFVDAGISRQRADQTDVRSFRRLNRADTRVVRIVNVSNLERRAVAVQAARAQRGKTALVG